MTRRLTLIWAWTGLLTGTTAAAAAQSHVGAPGGDSVAKVPASVHAAPTPVTPAQTPDTVRFRLMDVEFPKAVAVLGQYLDGPIVTSSLNGNRVTLNTPTAVPKKDVPAMLRAVLEGQGYELVRDSGGPYRVRQHAQTPAPMPVGPIAQGSGPTQLFVIHLNHARASDVAATVNALYGRATGFGDMSAPATAPTLGQELRQTQQSLSPQPNISAPGYPPRPGELSSETTIIPDAGTNSLLIRATPSDYALIEAAVKQVDVRPLQVLIEVIIAEAQRDRALSFGVDVSLPSTPVPRHPGTTVEGTQTGLGSDLGDMVLRVMGLGGDRDLQATLRAAATRGDVTIMSRPTVIAANNEKAEIVVGSQRPFVQVSRALPTDNAVRDQVVQYKDVGTKLSVRPTISSDGYVTLQVTQEVSAATNEFNFNAPVISTRSVQTQLLLKDGQTVVIGGLTDRQHQVTQSGVPILSSIPFVGGLFGRASRQTTETELFLFITPHVIRTDAEADSVTAPLQKRAGKSVH